MAIRSAGEMRELQKKIISKDVENHLEHIERKLEHALQRGEDYIYFSASHSRFYEKIKQFMENLNYKCEVHNDQDGHYIKISW